MKAKGWHEPLVWSELEHQLLEMLFSLLTYGVHENRWMRESEFLPDLYLGAMALKRSQNTY